MAIDLGSTFKELIDEINKKTAKGIYYIEGTGTTTGQWLGTCDDITEYYDGLTIAYKIGIAGNAPTTLNINNLGAKKVYIRGDVQLTTHYAVNTVIIAVYTTVSGTGRWYVNDYDANSNTVPSVQCETAADTAAKNGTCTGYTLKAKSFVHVNMRYANTYAGAITLNINSTGAKPIYLDGSVTASNNYSLPAGTYIVYYDGTNFYFRTDGMLTASITGNAATASRLGTADKGSATQPIYLSDGTPVACTYTLGKSVPSDAVFTDTTYSTATPSTEGLMSAADKTKLDSLTNNAQIIDISDFYVRITDLDSGIYRLTNNRGKVIYYNGATDIQEVLVFAYINPIFLHVNKRQLEDDGVAYWDWYIIIAQSNTSDQTPGIYYGGASTSAGWYDYKLIARLLTDISTYVKNKLDYSTNDTKYALSAYQGHLLDQRLQAVEDMEVATPTTDGLMSAEDKTELDRLTGIAVDKITDLNLESGQILINGTDDTGSSFYLTEIELECGGKYSHFTGKLKVPFVGGNNVTMEEDGTNNVVKINATDSLTMPIIRMGSATDTNDTMEISDDNPLTFTVEVIGGELQIGDELQLCAMKLFTYRNKETDDGSRIRKYKMRAFVKYAITAEDLGKRYISISVYGGTMLQDLLRGGGSNTSTVHNYYTKYLRIRRPHPDNPDNNAFFSNAVPFQVFGKYDKENYCSLGKVSIR